MQDYIYKKEDVQKAIMRVIVFFDMFDYPLTEFEIWKYLSLKIDFNMICDVVSDDNFRDRYGVENFQGFYFLCGRRDIVKSRMARYNYTDRKFKIALKVMRLFKFIPWIRLVAVGNIVGTNNLDDDGDIDLFIVTDRDRAWVTRLFCVGFMVMLRMRPQKGNERDKICLSFFVDSSDLNLQKIKISDKDIYFDHWFLGLKPIYDRDGAYCDLLRENKWIKDIFPNWSSHRSVYFRNFSKTFSGTYREVADLFFGGLNYKLKNWQIGLMPGVLRGMMNKDKKVIVNDGILKMHVNDRREKIQKKYLQELELRLNI